MDAMTAALTAPLAPMLTSNNSRQQFQRKRKQSDQQSSLTPRTWLAQDTGQRKLVRRAREMGEGAQGTPRTHVTEYGFATQAAGTSSFGRIRLYAMTHKLGVTRDKGVERQGQKVKWKHGTYGGTSHGMPNHKYLEMESGTPGPHTLTPRRQSCTTPRTSGNP